MTRLFKKPKVSPYDKIPPCQRKKIGLSPTRLKIYLYLADHPSATQAMIKEHTGYTLNHVKQIVFDLRHKFKAIRRVDGYAICDLRLGGIAHAWEKTILGAIPKEDYDLYFEEDGTRKYRPPLDEITTASGKAAFLTEMISSELIKYILAGGKIKIPAWDYWDFAKSIGCGMKTVMRPKEELMEEAKGLNKKLKEADDGELKDLILKNRFKKPKKGVDNADSN